MDIRTLFLAAAFTTFCACSNNDTSSVGNSEIDNPASQQENVIDLTEAEHVTQVDNLVLPNANTAAEISIDAGQRQFADPNVLIRLNGLVTANRALKTARWEQVEGPSATILNPNQLQTTALTPHVVEQTRLRFRLYAVSDQNEALVDHMDVFVSPLDQLPILRATAGQIDQLNGSLNFVVGLASPATALTNVSYQLFDTRLNANLEQGFGNIEFLIGEQSKTLSFALNDLPQRESGSVYQLTLQADVNGVLTQARVPALQPAVSSARPALDTTPVTVSSNPDFNSATIFGAEADTRLFITWKNNQNAVDATIEKFCTEPESENPQTEDSQQSVCALSDNIVTVESGNEDNYHWVNQTWGTPLEAGTYRASISHTAGLPAEYIAFLWADGVVTEFSGTISGTGEIRQQTLLEFSITEALGCTPTPSEPLPARYNASFLSGIPTNASLVDLNDNGVILGTYTPEGETARTHSFLWENGEWFNIGLVPDALDAFGQSLNNNNHVVGNSFIPRAGNPIRLVRGFLYDGETMTDLGLDAAGLNSRAFDINDSGQIVGWRLKGGVNYTEVAIIEEDGVKTDLGYLTGEDIDPPHNYSSAQVINNLGQVAGNSWAGTAYYARPFIWDNGVITAIPVPENTNNCNVEDFNALGLATISCIEELQSDTFRRSYVWLHGLDQEIKEVGTLACGDENVTIQGVNSKGTAIVNITRYPDENLERRAAVWSESEGLVDILSMTVFDQDISGIEFYELKAINNNGDILLEAWSEESGKLFILLSELSEFQT